MGSSNRPGANQLVCACCRLPASKKDLTWRGDRVHVPHCVDTEALVEAIEARDREAMPEAVAIFKALAEAAERAGRPCPACEGRGRTQQPTRSALYVVATECLECHGTGGDV